MWETQKSMQLFDGIRAAPLCYGSNLGLIHFDTLGADYIA